MALAPPTQAETEREGLLIFAPVPVPELPMTVPEQPLTGRRLSQIVDTSALIPLLLTPLAESLASTVRGGRRLQQEPEMADQENIVGPVGTTPAVEAEGEGEGGGRRLQQAGLAGLETSTPSLVTPPLAESLATPAGQGRRLQQAVAYEPTAAPPGLVPATQSLTAPAGLGRPLQQTTGLEPVSLLSPAAERLREELTGTETGTLGTATGPTGRKLQQVRSGSPASPPPGIQAPALQHVCAQQGAS